ncbi:galectin-5-like, partial [Stegodyphus dumicola]|uniref:galectin-5-like n=1 Tax=Stegodyphus dumicola TaxID=202533 RepID=UPI0015A93802
IANFSYSVNLQNGTNDGHRSDIALHLSPVFSPPPRIVRNSLENQNWGPEESHGSSFPFSRGQGFEILILVEVDHFKIAIDGQHFTEFYYRLPLHSISHISVDGDVSVNFIKFEGVSKSPMDSRPCEGLSKPLGFVVDSSNQQNLAATKANPESNKQQIARQMKITTEEHLGWRINSQ